MSLIRQRDSETLFVGLNVAHISMNFCCLVEFNIIANDTQNSMGICDLALIFIYFILNFYFILFMFLQSDR